MKSYALTDKGAVRKENQDCVLATEIRAKDCLAAVVCDGMGGVHGGKLASELAVSAFMADFRKNLLRSTEKKPDLTALLQNACAVANRVVYQYSCSNTECAGMGTTIVAAALRGGTAVILNIGDSRAYQITRRDIVQITRDHSLVEDMVARGGLSRAEARNHPKKNFITRALGVDAQVQADCFTVRLRHGDQLLLCSDGLSNTLPDETLHRFCRAYRSPEKACRRLIQQALDAGARDNVTAALVTRQLF